MNELSIYDKVIYLKYDVIAMVTDFFINSKGEPKYEIEIRDEKIKQLNDRLFLVNPEEIVKA